MTCNALSCIYNDGHGYCDNQSYINLDQFGMCDSILIVHNLAELNTIEAKDENLL